jgi:hypothetical protein
MSSSEARTSQRSREFLVEQHELQQLPASAVIVTYASPRGRQVVLADANPGIMTLRTSTLVSLDEAIEAAAASSVPPGMPEPPASSGTTVAGGTSAAADAVTAAGTTTGAVASGAAAAAVPPAGGASPEPPPNLGPPPERLDWRKPRNS